MRKILTLFFLGIVGFVITRVYLPWIINPQIIAGDWPYFYKEQLQSLSIFSPSWGVTYGNGLGGPVVNYTLDQYHHFTAFLTRFYDFPWEWVYKIFWFLPVVLFSIYSAMRLHKVVFGRGDMISAALAALIFSTNSYVLIITDGGQMGVALAYSLAPLVLAQFIILARFTSFRNMIGAGMVLALQTMLDLRIAYISLIAVSLYYLMRVTTLTLRRVFWIVFSIGIPIAITTVLHAAWTLPLLLLRQNPFQSLGQSYTASGMVKFLSFANFSNSLSLLHPNWPENIFGKVYFMRPEFIILPIIAFSSLLFIQRLQIDQRRSVLFFALLGLLGGFLGKGANPPMGELYITAFERVPGFVLFRDPTKFYILVGLSFSMLLPFAFSKLSSWLPKSPYNVNKWGVLLFATIFLVFWGISMRDALRGGLRGTFSEHSLPYEYVQLKDFLYAQPGYFRILMAPKWQRFVLNTDAHPLVDAGYLFNTHDVNALPKLIAASDEYLSELSIRYIIVPYDSLGEVFLTDRTYDEAQYRSFVQSLENIPWIKKVFAAGKITVFETPSYRDRFWVDKGKIISYAMKDPTRYVVSIEASVPSTLTFSENYDPRWAAVSSGDTLSLTRSAHGLMDIALPAGSHTVTVAYGPETYYRLGRYISIGSVTTLVLYMLISGVLVNRAKKNDRH